MRTIQIFISFTVILLVSAAVSAQDFISVQELSEAKKKDKYVVIDTRAESQYKTSHIRGAISIPVSQFSDTVPYDCILKDPVQITEALGKYGLNEKTNIVIYCNRSNTAGRLYWILKYLGAENVKMLDGNIGAWERAGEPLRAKPEKSRRSTTFNMDLQPGLFAYLDEVEKSVSDGTALLLDTRLIDFYNGTHADSEGHIPGAISLPSADLKTKNGLNKTVGELQGMLEEKGITSESRIILYDQKGIYSGYVLNILTTLLNYSNVSLYDGSYNEWVIVNPDQLEK